jgi:hypothetical protein
VVRRALKVVAVTAGTVVALGWLIFRPDRPLRVATGAVSHTLCSAAFVSGLDPQQVYSEEIESGAPFRPIRWALRYKVDPVRREVETSLLGTFGSRAVYRDGFGCLVLRGTPPPTIRLPAMSSPSRQGSIRVNDQWRICFEWREDHACGVEIVDYH